jgi:L-lactate dehydrogenase complex protein LldG
MQIVQRFGRKPIHDQPDFPFKGAPNFWQVYSLPLEERVQLFMETWRQGGGYSERFKDLEEAKNFIVHTVSKLNINSIIRSNEPELNKMDIENALSYVKISVWNGTLGRKTMLSRAKEAELGLIVADYAVAYTGSLVVMSSEQKGRSVSLLPNVLMAVVPVERIQNRMGEVLKHIHQVHHQGYQFPAGVHFISGPSRSADIENDLTIGVHGPGVVYALIVDCNE